MPKYIVNGKTYNIPGEKVAGFEGRYPDATVEYHNEGKTYLIPLNKRNGFLKRFPNASYTTVEPEKPIPAGKESYTFTEEQLVEGPQTIQMANREEIKELAPHVDSLLLKRGEYLDAENKRKEDNMPWFARIMNNAPRGGGMAGIPDYAKTNNGRLADNEYMSLQAAANSLRNAQRIIDEADHNAASGGLDAWLERSFAGGVARGLGQKLFDVRTWDMGVNNALEEKAIASALDAYEKGGRLSEGQQALLDAKAIELATNAYFGSYVGRGYKAGQVTAEAIPFMLEMTVNPASSIGKGVASSLSRYALKRFGKTAAKGIGRAVGDLATAPIMTATTGSIRTMADAQRRMNGDLQFTTNDDGYSVFAGAENGEDAVTAIAKAFGATTIENYSEMVGEYFAPLLKPVGKGIAKGLDKLHLGKVSQFIDDVRMSDVGRLVADFEENAKWSGVFGEYAEEVVGGIINALTVGDQTLDTDKDTGVFNLDNNIDTFLGVSLLGGFMSAAKTVGYRTPKYRAKKEVSKADVVANEMLPNWGELKEELSANNFDAIKKLLLSNDYTPEQRRAVLEYVAAQQTYSGIMQGEAKKKEEGNTDKDMDDFISSYDNGYTLTTPKEMNDAKNMYDYKRQMLERIVGEDIELFDSDALNTYKAMSSGHPWGENAMQAAREYVNAKATYDGVLQRVRDDIDERIEQSDAIVNARTNRTTGMIQPATMKVNDRRVYVIGGNIVQYADGSGIDVEASDNSIIVRDAETGELEQVSPDAVMNIDEALDPTTEMQTAADAIRQQYAQEAANRIDGVITAFNEGDTYTITGDDAQIQVQIVANDKGIVDNGDGTVNVSDGTNVFPLSKETIQQQVDEANLARVALFEQQKMAENAAYQQAIEEESRPQYALNDLVSLRDENGNAVRGNITTDADADGRYEVYTEAPINGKRVNLFTRDELDSMLMEHNGVAFERPAEVVGNNTPQNIPAMQRIPKDEQGNPIYEQTDSDTAWDAIVEQTEGDEGMAQTVADAMVADKEAALKNAQKAKSKGGATIAEKIAAEKERKAAIDAAQQELDIWKEIAGTANRRRMEAEAVKNMEIGNETLYPEDMLDKDVIDITTPEEFIALHIPKITPESFKRETGLSNTEQRNLVGFIAKPENGGVSVERAAELIIDGYADELSALGFKGDDTDVRNVIIEVLSYGNPRAYVKNLKAQREAEQIEQMRTQADIWAAELGFKDYDKYIDYEISALERIIQEYKNLDYTEFYNKLAEIYEYDTTRESESTGRGSEILQGEQTVPAGRGEDNKRRNQGRTVSDGLQVLGENGTPQGNQQVNEPVGEAGNLSSSEIPNSSTTEGGKAPGNSGVEENEEVGPFGRIYRQFKGKAKEAIQFLLGKKEGEAVGALSHPEIGDIDLVWGEEGTSNSDGYGLAKLAKYHPEVLENLQEIINDMRVTKRSANRVQLESDTHQAAVRLTWDNKNKNWLLTAFEKKNSVSDNTTDTGETSDGGKQNDTATLQNTVSADENTTQPATLQENLQESGEIAENGGENSTLEQIKAAEAETPTISQEGEQVSNQDTVPYTIAPAQYTTKKGEVLDMHLVKFAGTLTKEQQRAAKELAKAEKGWYDREQGGFMMRSKESAKQLADTILNNDDAVSDAQPVSMTDIQALNNGDVLFTEPQQVEQTDSEEKSPVWQYSIHVDKETGRTTLRRDDVSSVYPIGDARWQHTAASPEEMLDILRNPLNGMQDVLEAVGVTLENKIKTRELDRKSKEQAPTAETNPSGKRLVTDERYAELRERMRKKLGGQMNIGIDPEILAIGTEMAVYHLEKGARKFTEYAKVMIADLGDAIRPYLKAFYNGARNLPEVESSEIAADMTPYDEVQQFNVATFDKEHSDPFTTAEIVVAEQAHQEEAEQAKQEIINQRNTERRNEDEQTSANTEAIASQAETVADKAESDIETATTEEQLNDVVATIDKQIEEVNKQLALLGYYEADIDDSQFHESYGYMRSAEKKAVKDADTLAKRIVKDLGIDPASIVDKKGKKRKVIAQANIAPAGGDISIRLPLTASRELYIDVLLEPDYEGGNRDNLFIDHIYLRIEDPTAGGYKQFVGRNVWIQSDAAYTDMLDEIRAEIIQHVPEFDLPTRQSISETEQKQPKAKKSKKKTVNLQQSGELGLFDSLFDNETNNEDGLQRNDDVRTGGLQANNSGHSQGLQASTEKGSESEQQDSRGIDLGGERTGDAVDRTVRPRLSDTVEDKGIEGKRKKDVENNRKLADELKDVTLFVPDTFGVEHELSGFTYYELENVFHFTDNINGQRNATRKELDAILKIARKNNGKEEISEPKNTRNNHSERGKDHAPTSVDARIEANIKAIELAKQLLESGEQATEKQMQTLRKFSGWGGLGKAFSEGTYYAPNLIAKRLRELLGKAAYQEAVMSANSAYYTPAYVVDTLWDIAEQMGFKGGNILEGSAGIGNILGQMPTHISERSNIHAIEIDGTSGGILSLLYPDAKVEIQGFEETRIANGSVDLAITNVPFVTGLRVNDTTGDKDLSKKFHNIHDFCIAKNVRKLREGGLGIFITSNGTLDNSKKLRDWIVNEGGADFVGAFRMHNKTFGGTGVTSDIIVIRKRVNGKKSANAIDVSTVTGERMAEYDTGETRKVKGQIVPVVKQLSMDYNQYFVEHPENMAGEMHFAFEKGDTFRPTSKGLYPKQDKKQEQMLADFVQSFTAEEFGEKATDEIEVIDAMPGKKIGEVFVSDGKLYINAIGAAQPLEVNANKVKGHTKVECFEAYSAIKQALAEVLKYQTENEDDKGLKPRLAKLNKVYDDFVSTYGHFNKNTAIAFLRNDVDYANVFALEKFEESADAKGNKVQKFGKTDVFSKRVIEKEAEPMPTNVKDGIVASIFKFGRVDIPYIAEQLGKSEAEVKAEIIESGYGFEDPTTRQVEVSYQYLSGNVREKLRQAEENNDNGEFDRNIKALQEVMPMTIPAHLIDFTLGSSWIEPKLYEEYVKERTDVGVQFTAVGGTWFMNEPYYTAYEKNRAMGVTSEMLGRTVMGHTLIEAAIQNKSITVSTVKKNWDGSTETITDKEATQACSAKIDEIRQDFKEWARQKMQSDAEMSERMERVYNDTFNNYVPMSIPDEFVPEYFGGASHKFKMRSHQGRAIVRGTMQPLLLAHEVGTGKTFTLISTAMEMRRLGTARKPMIVVQNATVGQFVASAKELYPNAKILTLEEADRSADGRKNFYAKIKYNDWDMIVVPQSTFEFIPDSEERQMAFVQEKIEEKMLVLEQMKEADPDGKSMITRQAEREIALLEEELAGLSGETGKKRTANNEKKRAVALQNAEVKAMEMLDRRTDDVENFDDMGIDALLIDEAHEYKHLGFATAMQRGVKGVDPSYSKKSQGVFLKTQAVLEKNNGRNVIFATGTPISNTAAEIWTFMRYLMPADTMKEYDIYYFDDFVRNFGNIQQMLEFTTSGKFKENNRFAGYVNLPELVRIWSGVSDTVLTKEAGGVSDKIPDMEGGKAQDLYLPQTRALRSIMKYVKAELERYDKMSGKQKKENSHIPLTMYGIAKAAAVDARLVQSDAEDDTQSKTNEAVRQTLRSLKETADYKGTIAIFADNYQNKESGFNLYDDIRNKLIAAGVSADEVVVIRSGMTVKKKLEIFEKVNRGEVRVILGSTFTLGTGVNIQERLHTLIHLDAPNRPMDYTQRNGRILRQGNLHKAMGKPVRVLRFGVEDSLDVTAYQRLKTKGAIADSIMNGKQMMANSMTNRVLEEEEDVFGDTVAQLSGSEYAMLKNNAEKNVRKYASRKKQWEADQTYIHNAKPKIKGNIKDAEKRIEDNSRYLEAVRASFPDGKFKEIVIGKHRFTSVEAMEDFFKEHNKSVLAEMKQMKDGEIAGEQKRELTIQIGGFSFKVKTLLTKETKQSGMTLFTEAHKSMTYSCPELDIEDCPVHQQLLRNAVEDIVTNVITGKDFAERLEAAQRSKKHNEAELEQLLSREGKPFEYEEELAQAKAQYDEYAELMVKELAEKEAKYAEMDATVEAANDLANAEEDDTLYRSDDTMYRIREEAAPVNTGIGYKVFVLKNGELYPPMVANPNGEATPVGVWLDADAAPIAGQSKTGRNQVKAGGKGTQGGSGKLAYRPGWHLGVIPYALQFNRADETGERTLFPANFVWAEVEYANDVDYQEEAMSYGYNQNGKFQHSYAGLPRVPENGAYTYRTNPNPETEPWIITGAMRVKRLLTPTEVDEMVKAAGREPQRRQDNAVTDAEIAALNEEFARDYREGVGAYTDDEVSFENDPIAKVLGKSRRTAKQRREYAQRERQRMAAKVESLAKKLHLDNVEIVTDASQLEGKKQRAKGFYSKSTGKITIVIPNHTSTFDVEQTLLHEAVAHYGLRQLFGEHFDTFLDNVFNNADEAIRRRIVALATKNGWDFRKATEEYLAMLAENTEFENTNASWWSQIKDFFLNMLHKIGFEDFRGVTLTDNELRYILWRSYRNLAVDRVYNNVFEQAEDIAKQYELKVGNYAENVNNSNVAEGSSAEISDSKEKYVSLHNNLNTNANVNTEHGISHTTGRAGKIISKVRRIYDKAGRASREANERVAESIKKANATGILIAYNPLLRETLNLLRRLTNNEIYNSLLPRFEKLRDNAKSEQDRNEAISIIEMIRRFRNRNERRTIIRDLLGTELDEKIPLSKVDELFEMYNSDADTAELYKRVRGFAEELGISFSFEEFEDDRLGGIYYPDINSIAFNAHILYAPVVSQQKKASVFVHEIIHAITVYAMAAKKNNVKLSPELEKAAKIINNIYEKAVKGNPVLTHEVYNAKTDKMDIEEDYGASSAYEMVAELANKEFADKLKQIKYDGRNVWQKIWDAIKSLFVGPVKETKPVYEQLSNALDTLIDNFDREAFERSKDEYEFFNIIGSSESDDELYRDGDPEIHERELARDRYERRVKTGMFQSQEALQDSMLGLKEAMQAILGQGTNIEDVDGFENAYLGENRLSSVNKAEADAFAHLLFKPMLEEVAKLARNEAEREELTDYMMAKHGLERNRIMAERDAIDYVNTEVKKLRKELERKNIKEDEVKEINKKINLLNAKLNGVAKNFSEHDARIWYKTRKKSIDKLLNDGEIDEAQYYKRIKRLDTIFNDGFIGVNREKDYAGLTALTGMDNVADAEAEAQRMVDDYEQAHETDDLWEKVNAVSKAILQKSYECGMMSKETFDKVSDMYEFYIPLRGFDEKTSNEAYAYLTHKHSAFNAPIKKAEGRRSKADDPFANLQSMAESAIMQGNRNKLVKQRFLNFALNHPSDLVSVSDIWVEYDAVTDEWKPVFPDNIESTDTPEEVEQKMQDFETKMESLAQQHPDQYKRGKDAIGIPYRIVESRDMRQHQVVVKRGGRDYVITINGNPRAAQALNGQTNPDNDMSGAIGAILRAGEKINRQLSAFYTTRNPDFIVSNFMRDMLYTNSMAWIKESPNYALRFHRNYLMVNPVTMKRLLAKYRKGTLDMSNKTEAMFHQFMMNGGETGYANIRDIEQHKNDIRKELKRANGKLKLARAWSLLAEKFDELNRAVENCARFAAFVTSREMGRSIDRAIYDAKEISVNFNKKGSGAKFYDSVGQTKAGNASALVSGLGRSGYVFWNAAIQGTTNFGRQMKRHPAKAFTGVAAMFLLGAIVAYLGGDDDEDDKNAYYNLPEYVRRSNILFRAGDSWISIPLPIEYRAFYGMGELMTSVFSGKEHLTGGEIAEAVLGQATQILPIDFLEGGGGLNAFVPSAAKPLWEAYVAEKSWTGMPLYKDTPFNKDMPEWTKAYSSTNKHIVNLAATLNEATGGDPYTKGAIDINPAKVEYMLNGYFGGVFGTIDKLTKTAETIVGDREYDPRSILLVNRLVKAGDERTEYRAVNNEYFRLKEEHDRLKTRLRHYEEDTDNGIFDYAEKMDFLYNSPEYERYEIFEDYRKDIDDLYDEMQEAVDDEERKDIEAELNELKKEMIQEMNTTRKRK